MNLFRTVEFISGVNGPCYGLSVSPHTMSLEVIRVRLHNWFLARDLDVKLIGRFEMKASYQRVLLLGWIPILLLVLAFSLYISSLDSPSTDTGETQYAAKNVRINDNTARTEGVKPAKTSVPSSWKPYPQHQGFLGFVGDNVKIVDDDKYDPNPSTPDMTGSFTDLEAEIAADFSFSPIEGENTGMYVPENLVSIAGDEFDSGPEEEPVSCEASVVNFIQPGYPFTASEDNMEGVVKLLIHLDRNGNRTLFSYRVVSEGGVSSLEFYVDGSESDTLPMVILEEDPQSYHFADSAIAAINKWVFSPEIVEGTPVDKFLEVTYRFCLGITCHSNFEVNTF